jgi:hypothetical protein
MSRRLAAALAALALTLSPALALATMGDDLGKRTAELEKTLAAVQQQLAELRHKQQEMEQREKAEADETASKIASSVSRNQSAIEGATARTLSLLERVKIGGYGSLRFETDSLNRQHDTFTLRRVVMTTDAQIAPRLRFYSELEFERFRKLEVDKTTTQQFGGLTAQQSIEATDQSEISLEQAWLQYDLTESIGLRLGAVLVPLGRFNLHHDDNLWNLPRRTLVDRGVPVLPSAAAWDELGVGLVGRYSVGQRGSLDYQFYVLNGVSLDSEIENIVQTRSGDTSKFEAEVEVKPQTGTFANDSKSAKALSGRVAYSPAPGHEIAPSFYWGRYTPSYLPSEDVWSLGLDGISTWGPVQLEGEYIFTRFEGIDKVAKGFAQIVGTQESEAEIGTVETELDFELSQLARTKHGYWLEARYNFWPEFLSQSILARGFSNPQLIPLIRMEQVWIPSLLTAANFTTGALTNLSTDSRLINRISAGIAYRPTPLVVFQLAYEFTRTNSGKSLSDVTNFIVARPTQNQMNALLAGAAFGF